MANIMRWDPFRLTRGGGDPFSELRREMGRLFDQFYGGREMSVPDIGGEWAPLVETYMKGDNLMIRCELPGVDLKDVDVSFDERSHQLVIKGERKQDTETKEGDYIYREMGYGSFERRFTLPPGVKIDQMKASYTNGMLDITVPTTAEAKSKKIQIETAEGEKKAKKAA